MSKQILMRHITVYKIN